MPWTWLFAIVYLAITAKIIWAVKKTRPLAALALSFVLIGGPVLGVTWLALELFHPETLAFSKTDHPLRWVKVTTRPPTTDLLGFPRRRGETIFYIKSASGQWKRISFTDRTLTPNLAVLSPDAVLIAGRRANGAAFVGAVFKRGLEEPAALIPDSDYICPVPSGGFVATQLERDAQLQGKAITIEKYDSTGELVRIKTISIPGDLVGCSWGQTERLIGDDMVYGASGCHDPSGLYLASPTEGIQQLAQYTGKWKDDYERLSSLTKAPNWYRGAWTH